MSQTHVAALLDIKDGQIAKRLFEIIAGDQGEIDAERFKSAIVSLVRGDDQAKLKFVFDLYDQDGDGAISRADLSAMVEASLHHNHIKIAPRERKAMTKLLFDAADRKGDNRVDLGEFKKLLSRSPPIRAALPLAAYSLELYLKRNRKREVSLIEEATALASGVSRLIIRKPSGA